MRRIMIRFLFGFFGLFLISELMMVISSLGVQAEEVSEAKSGELAKATFAGGCFWCMQPPFDKLEGVVATSVGYTGGHRERPTYKEVSAGTTGHAEAIEVIYDPRKISYDQLLETFWRNIDPLDQGGQFCDRGSQYRAAIFYHDQEQKRLAEQSREQLGKTRGFKQSIVTEIVSASRFYSAEDYHQHYYKENPVRYKMYRYGCGRDKRLEQLWGEGK